MKTTEHKASRCPVCGHRLDASTSVEGDATPKPGDLSVCIGCAAALTYRQDLTVTRIGPVELESLSAEERAELERAQAVVREVRRAARRS